MFPHDQIQQRHRGDPQQNLRNLNGPCVHAKDPGRDLHGPQRGRGLINGDRVATVRRPEKECLPTLGTCLYRRGVVGIRPTVSTEAVQPSGCRDDQQQRISPTLTPGDRRISVPRGYWPLPCLRFQTRNADGIHHIQIVGACDGPTLWPACALAMNARTPMHRSS